MFQGFSDATIDFLWGIRFNNDRTWFEAHKQDYQTTLYQPMKALCADLYEGYAGAHKDLDLTARVCRIYRDARRLHGRGPYKDHLWLTLSQPAEQWSATPSYWFELTPEGYSFGLGYWMAQSLTMAKLRARMDRDPAAMEKLVRQLNKHKEFTLTGEDFKRPKPAPTPLLQPWYNKKNGLSLSCERAHEPLLYTPDLVPYLLREWEKLTPLFRCLSTLDGDPDPRDA